MSKGTQETEIKLAVKDARSARRLLREAGFVVSKPRVFEANTVFDTPELSLRTCFPPAADSRGRRGRHPDL